MSVKTLLNRLRGHNKEMVESAPKPQELTAETCEVLKAKAREDAIRTCDLMKAEALELIDSIRVFPNENNLVYINSYKAEGVKNYMKFLTYDLDKELNENAHHKCGYCSTEFKGVFSRTLVHNHEWAAHPEECKKATYILGSILIYGITASLLKWKPEKT